MNENWTLLAILFIRFNVRLQRVFDLLAVECDLHIWSVCVYVRMRSANLYTQMHTNAYTHTT